MATKLSVIGGSSAPDAPPMPSDLKDVGRALWTRVMSEYALVDCGGVTLLTQACRCADTAEMCRLKVLKDGPVIRIKGVPKEHPLLKIELANRALLARLISRLGLDVEPVRSIGRPPGFA